MLSATENTLNPLSLGVEFLPLWTSPVDDPDNPDVVFRVNPNLVVAVPDGLCIACGESAPEITVDDADITLDHVADPFTFKSELTPEQVAGDATVLVAYGEVTHWIKDKGPITRIPGRVIAWIDRQVEVLYPGQGEDEYIKVWVVYGEDFDTGKLHDNKENLARCRFDEQTGWPKFTGCNQVN